MKMIKISDTTHQQLVRLKKELNLSTFETTILYLISKYYQNQDQEVSRNGGEDKNI